MWCRPALFAAWLILLSLLAVPCGVARAQGPEGAALVQQLGDDSYPVRVRAAQQLAELGLKASEALTAGLKHVDPQVRRHCRWILADVMEADFQQRLKAFQADTEDKEDHRMPGWERYRRTVGSDAEARKLFVEMVTAESGLLESAAAGPAAAAEALSLRLQQFWRAMTTGDHRGPRMPSLGTSAAMLFVASDPQLDAQENLNEYSYLINAIQQQEFNKALTQGPLQVSARRLLAQWIARPAHENILYNKLNLALQYDLKEGLEVALRLARNRQAAIPHYRVQAIGAIGRWGGKDYAAVLEALMDDKSEIFRGQIGNNKEMTVQMRDVALAWLVYLTGQEHAAYGMEQAKNDFENLRKNPKYMPNFPNLGFGQESARDEALKKWRAYVAENPLPKAPAEPPRAEPKPAPPQAAAPAAPGAAVAGPPAIARAALAPMPVAAQNAAEPENAARGAKLQMADRLQVQALTLARQLCQRGQYTEATRLLDGILAAEADYAFQPDIAVPLLRCLKPEAERMISELPPEGRDAYRLQFEVVSQRALAEAIKAGNVKGIAAVAERFFHTQAGAEATYLLAAHYRDRGHPLHAALFLERLRNRSHSADRFEPALSLALATCLSRAGMPQAADEVLRKLRTRQPRVKVRVAGEDRELFAAADPSLRWLESLVGPWQAAAADGWLMYRGGPTRNTSAEAANPLLRGAPLITLCTDADIRGTVEKLRQQQHAQYRVALPKGHPLVVGETIVLRTATHLAALDLASGRLLWDAPLEDALRSCLQEKGKDPAQFQSDAFTQAIRRRFWEDLTFGTLSSDGRSVFGVEDASFGIGGDYRRLVVGPDGRRRLDTQLLKKHNLLTAYDVRTGKLKWEIGGPPGPGMRELAGRLFLGPPLPLGGRLYVMADANSETQLMELDADTGALLSELTLPLREPSPQPEAFMFAAGQPWMTNHALARSGSSPSYADGVLVCSAGDSQYVAVSLATRAVLWAYQLPDQDTAPWNGFMFGVARQRKMLEAVTAEQANRWADGSVTIAEGCVLLTPADTNELLCLDLADGRLLWSAPRRDGVYIGGVEGGRVLVVGRGSVCALSLTDGTPAWPQERLSLPPGAMPSGRGVLSPGRYLLPLSTGEVAAIDLRQGRLLARCRSADNVIPGNLVACRNAVLSQNVDGLWRFDTLAARDRQLLAALRDRPDDPDLLAERGEVLLGNGQIVEAVAALRRAMEIKPAPRPRQLLCDALTDGIQADFDTFAKLAEELDPVVQQDEGRPRLLREYAAGLQRAGRPQAAFQAYLKLIDLGAKPEELERLETARLVRRDRWIAARLVEVRNAAAPAERAEIDRQVAGRLKDDRLKDDRLRDFVTYFAFHPAAGDARLRLAEQSIAKNEGLEAERLLRSVLRSGSPEQQRAAIARLAALLRDAKQTEDAARCYECLRGELAAAVCLEGKTGREIFAGLPADDPVRRSLESPLVWPKGKVQAEVSAARLAGNQRIPLLTMWEDARFATDLSAEVDIGNRRIFGYDTQGRKRWECSMAEKDQQWQFINYQDGTCQVWPVGHLLVVWVGNRVGAIDGLSGQSRILWTQEPLKMNPQFAAMGLPFRVRMQQGQPPALPASDPLPLCATAEAVCFLQNRTLQAVDLLSGAVLWSRDDFPLESSLFGDNDMLMVTPPDSNEAVVLSMLDGSDLGRRRVPALKDRLWTLGRRVATWSVGPQKVQLALVDPWTQQTLWQRDFDVKAQPWLVNGEEIAVLDPQGQLAIVALRSGELLLEAQVDRQPTLEGIFVLDSASHYVLIARESAVQNQPMIIMQPFMGHCQVNGRVYGLERRTGKLVWSTRVERQAIKLNQPGELPVLTFFNQTHVLEGQSYRPYSALLCLDKRNGRVLYSKESKEGHPNLLEIQADPEKSSVEVRTYMGTTKLTFTNEPDDPAAAKPK